MPAELTRALEHGASFVAQGLHAIEPAKHLALCPFAELGRAEGLLELPFADRTFSELNLRCQLDPETDDGSRRPSLRAAALAWFRDRLPRTTGLRVVDLMAGPGLIAGDLLAWDIASYTGIEIGPAIVEHARAHVSSPRVRFEQADVAHARSLDAAGSFDLALLSYEAVNAMAPARLTATVKRLSRALAEEAFIAIEVRLPGDWSEGPPRSFALAPQGSVFAPGSQLILDERGHLPDRRRFGHRLGVILLADPDRVASVYCSFIWIYREEELIELFASERFFSVAQGRPLLELPTDAVESAGNTFLLLRRAPSD